MKFLKCNLLILIALSLLFVSCEQQNEEKPWSEKMADSEMVRFPELWMIEKATKPRWTYTFGLVAKSMLELWEVSGDQKYFDYAKLYADSLITDGGQIKTYSMQSYNIDNVSPGKILFDLYAQTNDPRYKQAIDTLYTQMQTHPRTSEGGYWHKLKYPHQMWLDGIYMASPFLVQYAAVFNEPALYDDVVNQITMIARHTYDEEAGLFYHGWDESREQFWADKETGTSPGFWSRSMGWYAAALVDVLDFLPEDHQGCDSLLVIVNTLASGMKKYQDPATGVWYQVTDQGNREGNYLESSGSALFVFLSRRQQLYCQSYRIPQKKDLTGSSAILSGWKKTERTPSLTVALSPD